LHKFEEDGGRETRTNRHIRTHKVALTSGNIVARARDATAFVADQIGG